jgi:hypothetical protein
MLYFQVLIHRSHALLNDEIATAIYNMAAVDLMSFYDSFIAHFLQMTDNLDDQQRMRLRAIFNNEQVIVMYNILYWLNI